MQKVSNCPVCGKQIELIPDPNDPTKEAGFCNHGAPGTIAHCVISQPAAPELEPAPARVEVWSKNKGDKA